MCGIANKALRRRTAGEKSIQRCGDSGEATAQLTLALRTLQLWHAFCVRDSPRALSLGSTREAGPPGLGTIMNISTVTSVASRYRAKVKGVLI